MKAHLKNYLSITKKEWNGMVVLVVLIAGVLAAPYVYQLLRKDNTINFKDFEKAAATLNRAAKIKGSYGGDAAADQRVEHPVMFVFNPNKLPVVKWQQLGLSLYQANMIKHYEKKGGRFYSKTDLSKIYAITDEDYKRLEPYINLPEGRPYANTGEPAEKIELNSTDAARLTMIRGVGPSFADRIIRYRQRLGGFYRKEQLKEVFGVDSLNYKEIAEQVHINPALVSKIDINAISFNQLRLFPYLNYKQANALIAYRTEHGSYHDIADLRNVVLPDDALLHKIDPYLKFK